MICQGVPPSLIHLATDSVQRHLKIRNYKASIIASYVVTKLTMLARLQTIVLNTTLMQFSLTLESLKNYSQFISNNLKSTARW